MNRQLLNFYTLIIVNFTALLTNSCVKESTINLVADTFNIAKIYQPDGIMAKDAIIESIAPDQNFGDSVYFSIFSWTNGGSFNTARALIEFDLSAINPQTKIASAKLSIYWISYQNLTEHTGENSFSIFKIIQAWKEDSVTWNNQPLTSDVNIVSIPKSTSTDQSYTDIDVTAFVQDMINFPNENYGFMLKLDEEFPYKLVILASSDFSESDNRPKLTIVY